MGHCLYSLYVRHCVGEVGENGSFGLRDWRNGSSAVNQQMLSCIPSSGLPAVAVVPGGSGNADVGYGNAPLYWLMYIAVAWPSVRRLARHLSVIACCRALFSAGNNRAVRIAMIPMTTSNSTSVNPPGRRETDLLMMFTPSKDL